jgi:DNA replication protein DnaC
VIDNKTVDGLYALKLTAMAAGLEEQQQQAAYHGLSFEERLGLLVDKELAERETRRVQRWLKAAKLRSSAVVEEVDFRRPRGLERAQVLELAEAGWVRSHQVVAVVGATGVGKTFLACALANAAVRRGHTALYLRGPRMLDELAVARADGRFARLLATWARTDVLVIDDWLLRPLGADQAADVLEVIEVFSSPGSVGFCPRGRQTVLVGYTSASYRFPRAELSPPGSVPGLPCRAPRRPRLLERVGRRVRQGGCRRQLLVRPPLRA